MSAALTEIAIGLACNSRLSFGDWFNGNVRFSDKKRRLAIGSRLPSINSADSTKLAADKRRIGFLSIARAQSFAGSSRRIAISADVSMIFGEVLGHRKVAHRDRPAPLSVWRTPCQSAAGNHTI